MDTSVILQIISLNLYLLNIEEMDGRVISRFRLRMEVAFLVHIMIVGEKY